MPRVVVAQFGGGWAPVVLDRNLPPDVVRVLQRVDDVDTGITTVFFDTEDVVVTQLPCPTCHGSGWIEEGDHASSA